MDITDKNEFPMKRLEIARYFYFTQILIIIIVGIWFVGLGIILAILHAVTLGPWLTKKQARALTYWLDGRTLRADSGVFFLKRKAIPLDRITNVSLDQGPVLKYCGIWELRIQTAGMGQAVPEATLYGLTRPEQVRDLILKERDKAVLNKNQEA
ncbi:MAG: PH domain-containing protein [Sedimentisphaerales bacterium]